MTAFCPTFAQRAGASLPAGAHGRDLWPVMSGEETRAFARSEWKLGPARCGVALDLRAVRTVNGHNKAKNN